MDFSASIEIKAQKPLQDAYFNALKPESDEKLGRATCSLKKEAGKLAIKIDAQDATSFRAALTSLLGLISVVERTSKKISDN